jgi:hypothetical protein
MSFRAVASILLFCSCAGGILSAVPANDAFANRAPLPMTGASGTNVEATVEAGEPAPLRESATTATVWWNFTPPAPGWYEITSSGSTFDTVLAVYRGTDLPDLVRVASADNDALNNAVTTSRVWFHAAAATAYAVQVGSYHEQFRGAIVLEIQPVAQPANRVVSLNYSSSPVNATSSDQTITVTFSLEQSAPLDFGRLSVAGPQGSLLDAVTFSAAERIAGTAVAGTYRVNVTVPRHAPNGNYPVWITGFPADGPTIPMLQAGGWAWNSLPSSVIPHLTVTNSGSEDTAPPSLPGAFFSQSSIDVTETGVLVPLTLQISDDLSGLKTAAVSLEQTITGSQTAVLVAGTATASNRTSGTALSGEYLIQFFVPQNAPAGNWQLRCVLADRLGNTANITPSGTLTVTKNPYPAWVTARNLTGPAADPGADPDHDGQTNLEEFAFHTDPKVPQFDPISLSVPEQLYLFQGAPPLQHMSGDRLHIRFLRRRGANAGTISTVPQFGADLSNWSAATDLVVTPLSADWEMVDARDTATLSTIPRRLGRVLVTIP